MIRKSRAGWYNPTWGTCKSHLDMRFFSRVASPVAIYLWVWTLKYPWKEDFQSCKISWGPRGRVGCSMLVLAGETSAQMGLWFSAFHECNPPNQSLMYDWTLTIWLPRVCEILPELSMSFPRIPSWFLGIFHPLSVELAIPGGVNSNGEIGDEYYEVVGRPRSCEEFLDQCWRGEP